MNKLWVALLAAMAFALGAGAVWWLRPKTPPPAPHKTSTVDLAPLKEQLQQAAEKSLPLPSLEPWKLELSVPAKSLEERIDGLKSLATTLHGSAMRGLDRDGVAVLLVTLPLTAQDDFYKRAGTWPIILDGVAMPTANEEKTDGEVLLHPTGS